MSVPAPRQVADFRPGIGVQQIVARQMDIGVAHQAPVVDEIGAHQVEVGRQFRVATDVSAQARFGLIDTDHVMVGEGQRQRDAAFTDAATGVENQWSP